MKAQAVTLSSLRTHTARVINQTHSSAPVKGGVAMDAPPNKRKKKEEKTKAVNRRKSEENKWINVGDEPTIGPLAAPPILPLTRRDATRPVTPLTCSIIIRTHKNIGRKRPQKCPSYSLPINTQRPLDTSKQSRPPILKFKSAILNFK